MSIHFFFHKNELYLHIPIEEKDRLIELSRLVSSKEFKGMTVKILPEDLVPEELQELTKDLFLTVASAIRLASEHIM